MKVFTPVRAAGPWGRRALRWSVLLLVLVSLVPQAVAFGPGSPQSTSPRTYTVLVGLEFPSQGISINAYFPETVTIHVGDTVHWVQNSNEIHTVTFLGGLLLPDLIVPAATVGGDSSISPLVFNPVVTEPSIPAGGEYQGGPGAYANSGLMGRESWQFDAFDLTFMTEGTFAYVCIVHGFVMSGVVEVVAPQERIPLPSQAAAQGRREMARNLSKVFAAVRAANRLVEPPDVNPDGSMTHHVLIGYGDGQIDLLQFFPKRLVVRPGDTVIWEMSPYNDAPHTVTFLNGATEPELVVPVSQSDGSILFYANPAVFFPDQPSTDLTRSGVYSSGVMNPVPGTTFTLDIGDMWPGLEPYLCLLHDTSGMKGELIVVPKPPAFDFHKGLQNRWQY